MQIHALAVLLAAGAAAAGPVIVAVDMDAAAPGIQSSVRAAPGTTVVPGVAVYVYDPQGNRTVGGVGYFGGLDRGISFGHMTSPGNAGQVTAFAATMGAPINPAAFGFVFPAMDPGFEGPEVQYIESSAVVPGPIQQAPVAALFTVDIHLAGAGAGDVYEFFLLDYVTIWTGGAHGAFSTLAGTFSLDTGGDTVPDQTRTIWGIDPDTPIPSPPASFEVDYVDGNPGPATIRVESCYPDCNGDGALNLADFGCFQTRFALSDPYADCNGDGALNLADFGCFQTKFALGCP